MADYTIESWFTEEDLKKLEYSDYWNDEQQEQSKEWNILDGNYAKMENYLDDTGLTADLELCLNAVKVKFGDPVFCSGIDLASGNLWAVPHLFRLINFEKLFCVEYSRHRLYKLGPRILEYYQVPADRVSLVFGSFYSIKLPDESLDFVFMSQAFHHADKPDILLSEITRILKPKGVVIMIGEHNINLPKLYLKDFFLSLCSKLLPQSIQKQVFGRIIEPANLLKSKSELLTPDPTTGDHYYTNKDYRQMFTRHGFDFFSIRRAGSVFQSFILSKR